MPLDEHMCYLITLEIELKPIECGSLFLAGEGSTKRAELGDRVVTEIKAWVVHNPISVINKE